MILAILGLILSLAMFITSIIGISYFRNIIKENESPTINTGVKTYWKYEYNDDDDEYFIYNDKKYVHFPSTVWHRPNSRVIDKPVANIIESGNILARLFMSIFGIKERNDILYTIKGYPDDSLLIFESFGSLYCEESKYSEKINYYDNIDNYKYYATYGHLPEETESIVLYNEDIIKEIYLYSGSSNLIQRPPEDECNYLFIFGISNDGVLIKDIASIIIHNNQPYKEFGYFTENEANGMAALDKTQSEYINRIIIENGW